MDGQQTQPQVDVILGWCKVLDPEVLRHNLHAIGVYLVAFELMQSSVVDQLRDFVTVGCDDEDAVDQYQRAVLHRDRSPFRASMLWFREMGAVEDEDLAIADEIRQHRNELAHEMPRFLASEESNVDVTLFHKILDLITKVDRWWIREIELDCNPDFDQIDLASIRDEEITSGNMLLMHLILKGVFGDYESTKREYEQFLEAFAEQKRMHSRSN